jgi:hypothetical protein
VDERENLSKADNAEVLKLATRALDTAPEGSMKDAFARALEKRTPSTVDTEELRGLLLKAAEEKHAAVQETALNTGAVHAEAPVQPALTGKQVDFHGGSGTVLKESPTKLFIEDHETGSKRWIAREDVLDAPEVDGFLAGSVGGAQVAHTPVERTAMTEIRIPFTKTFNGRFDIFAQLNASTNPVVQRLGKIFVKDAINPSDFYAQGRSASEDKKLLQRTIGGGFHARALPRFGSRAEARVRPGQVAPPEHPA